MMRALPALAIVIALFARTPAHADIVLDDAAAGAVTLTIDNASVADALKALHERYHFELEGLSKLGSGDVLTATISGSVYDVVTRLLRNRNYSIVRLDGAPGGIRRVTIIDEKFGATASKPNDGSAPPQGTDQTKTQPSPF